LARAQAQRAEMARREHVAAIFAAATEGLGSARLRVRLSAICSLREITEACLTSRALPSIF